MTRRFSALLLAVAVALALAGATVAVTRSTAGDGLPSDPRAAVVDALAARPGGGAGSARYVVRYLIENPGIVRVVGTFEGEADFRRQRFQARGRIFGEDDPPRDFDSFVFARWQYTRAVGERRWRRGGYDPSEVGSPTPELGIIGLRQDDLSAPAYAGDAATRRRIVDALVAEVVPVGSEEQHGATVWHYRVVIDRDRAAAGLPEALLSEMKIWHVAETRREVDVWLDGKERLRKLSVFYPDEQGRGFRIENEFWDFGGPGPLDLPDDLDDPTAEGGEGTTSFTVERGVDLDRHSPSFGVDIFGRDRSGEDVRITVRDRPVAGAESRRRDIHITPAPARHLEPGEYRLADRREFNRGVPRTFYVTGPEVDARCPPDRPRSGALKVEEAVMYEERFYVRLHLRFTVSCPSATDPVEGELRFHALT